MEDLSSPTLWAEITRTTWDVVVAGGGPAGASLAALLARQGRSVLLVEASRYPKDKLCGEFLSPDALACLNRRHLLDRLEAAGAAPIQSVVLTAGGRSRLHLPLPGPALGLSRRALDHLLWQAAEEAGVTLLTGARVASMGLSPEGEGEAAVRLAAGDEHRRLSARLCVAAYGKRPSLLPAPSHRRREGPLAFQFHLPEIITAGRVELHCFPGGYCGLAPVEGGRTNVCLLVQHRAFRRSGGGLDGLLSQARRENSFLGAALPQGCWEGSEQAAIAAIDLSHLHPVREGVLHVGDAACLIHPFTGDGIAMALRSAELAAECLLPALQGRDHPPEALRRYQRLWFAEFRGRVRLARALSVLFWRPALIRPVLRLASSSPGLGGYLIRKTRGTAGGAFALGRPEGAREAFDERGC